MIATVIAIFAVATLAWIGDWFGVRMRRSDDKYWLSTSIYCPDCNHRFSSDEILHRRHVVSESRWFGAVMDCPDCKIGYEFKRSDGAPCLVGESSHLRKCLNCNDWYNGTSGGSCPTCTFTDSEPYPDPPFDRAGSNADIVG